jgi:hypothetical protein
MCINFKRRIELLGEHITTFSYIFKHISCQWKYNVSEFVFPFFLEVEASFWG